MGNHRFAVIDLETTGGRSGQDRITEIAILVHDGERVVAEWSSLINPGQSIPGYITDITGISDDMVADAPPFYEVAKTVVELTEGCIFVAHNVRFDYGFLQAEFGSLGYDYQRPLLCTVRQSRRLIPGLASYSLGRLCHVLGIPITARHRAMGDAEATAILLGRLLALDPSLGQLGQARDPFKGIPEEISRQTLSMLPSGPGLYFFHGPGQEVVHMDKAAQLKRDALKGLRAYAKKTNVPPLADISWVPTGSELLAQIQLEEALARQQHAVQKRRKRSTYKVGLFAYADQRGYHQLYIAPISAGQMPLAEFADTDDARAALTARVRKHKLCASLSGLEKSDGDACSLFYENICQGACKEQETSEDYNARQREALRGIGFPHPRFLLVGNGRTASEVSVVCVEDGKCLGYAYLDAEMAWSDPAAVIDQLEPLSAPHEGSRIVRGYLPKLKQHRILPF